MSYNGVGLKSAKGSSTSGHIQRSLANNDESKQTQLKNYTARRKASEKQNEGIRKVKVPTQDHMLKHISKRRIEVLVSELRDELEDKDMAEDIVEERCRELRKKLISEQETEQRISKVYKSRAQREKITSEHTPGEDVKETKNSQ